MSDANPKLKDLVNELDDEKAKWRAIGTQLEVSWGTLEAIATAYKDPGQALAAMLSDWLTKSKNPTWSDIVQALRAKSVGATNLARSLERNKCPVTPDTDETPDCSLDITPSDTTEPQSASSLQMIPYHDMTEVQPAVLEGIRRLSKHLNTLRIKVFRHVISLEEAKKVTPNDFRLIILNPERCWVDDHHKRVCLAKSIPEIIAIISLKYYLNWQNYDLLEEIILEYGGSGLKADLDSYCKETQIFESENELSDIKNIIFTPLGNRYLMKVPVPNGVSQRRVKNGLKRNGYPNTIHHCGQNSPLSLFIIVPKFLFPLPNLCPVQSDDIIEQRIICTLSEDDVFRLLDLPLPSAPGASLEPSATPAPTVEVFEDKVLHNGSTTVVCKGKFNNLPCAAKYVHQNLTASGGEWQKVRFQKGCDFLKSCQHPNIVLFLGLDLQHPLAPVLLTELMDESLEQYLEQCQTDVPLHVQIDICADVAHGLEYIHEKGYIYGDLNVSNVLLKGGCAKIGGLMSLIDKSADETPSFPPGSPQCMPMQSFRFPYNESIDCFSFGILAIHVATGNAPLPCCTSAQFDSSTEIKRFQTSLDQVCTDHPLRLLILDCLKEVEAERPTAAALATELFTLKESQQYTLSRQTSEGELDSMKSQIRDMERERNRATIDHKEESLRMGKKLRKQTSSANVLKDRVSEKEIEIQRLKQELVKKRLEYKESEQLQARKLHEVTESADMFYLAMNFAYQTKNQDCEMAKHKAQNLSDEGKETSAKLKALEKAQKTLEDKYQREKERNTDLKKRCIDTDERYAKLCDQAEQHGVNIPS
jgi:serine/threonine protein kinase